MEKIVYCQLFQISQTIPNRIDLQHALTRGKNLTITYSHWHCLTEILKHIPEQNIILMGSLKAKTNLGIVHQKHYVTNNQLCAELENRK
jgi:hypothetical protein